MYDIYMIQLKMMIKNRSKVKGGKMHNTQRKRIWTKHDKWINTARGDDNLKCVNATDVKNIQSKSRGTGK